MRYTIEGLIHGIPNTGSYSGVIAELERVLDDPQNTILQFGEVIEKDPDLTARLLRLANSAFYGFRNRLETVAEAITLIGLQQVQDLLTASNLVEIFDGIAPQHVTMKSFWRHSLACGVAARLIALERRLPKPDKFFVAGLLHDLGRLVLLSHAPAAAQAIFDIHQAKPCLLREAEQEVLGFDHAAVGRELLRTWNYPARLVNAVSYHHHPVSAGVFQMEASVVHLADWIVNALELGNSGERYIPPLNATAWDRINLPLDQLLPLMDATEDQIESVEQAFLSPHTNSSGPEPASRLPA